MKEAQEIDKPLTCKELAEVWSIPVTKTSQAYDGWELKTGKFAGERPMEFAIAVARAIARARAAAIPEPNFDTTTSNGRGPTA